MSTQQQIDDPGQWRVGDMFEGEHDGHPFSGPIWALGMDLYVGGLVVRHGAQWVPSDKTGHVTRTVEPIPEPTEPWALVRFAVLVQPVRGEGGRVMDPRPYVECLGCHRWVRELVEVARGPFGSILRCSTCAKGGE